MGVTDESNHDYIKSCHYELYIIISRGARKGDAELFIEFLSMSKLCIEAVSPICLG